jgi:Ca2+-binding RTX toxin-like protein
VRTANITWDATTTSADVLAALSAVLNPNNVNDALPFTDNVAVTRHGDVLRIALQGEDRDRRIVWVEVSGGLAVDLADRASGIDYFGAETLNISFGSGDDVLNVQGTSAITRTDIALGDGDERIYVSSQADYGLAEPEDRPDYLRGHLDDVRGTLNLDAGSGRHLLMISDEAALLGDGGVWITEEWTAGDAAAMRLAPDAEILVAGLAQGAITFRAAADGTFADGITIWAGSGADAISIDATHERDGVRTVTALHTGLGDDEVWVDLQAADDGFFVLDTQGGHQHVLAIADGLRAGDHHTAPDTVRAWIDGVLTPVSHDPRTGAVSLLTGGPIGGLADVEIRRTYTQAFVLAGPSVDVTAPALGAGDEISVQMNGADVAFTRAGNTITPAGAITGGLLVVTVVRTFTESFTLPQVAPYQDDDTVHGEDSTLPLIIFGGLGDDDLTGGQGGDIVFGDRGRVLFFDTAFPIPAVDVGLDLAGAMATLEAAAATVLGRGGSGDRTDGVARGASLVISVDTTLGGDDRIVTGLGHDVLVGGAGADDITAGDGDNVVLGDNGRVTAGDRETYDVRLEALPRILGVVAVLSPAVGGDDRIRSGAGRDLAIGGTGDDDIATGAGDDIALGDNGALIFSNERDLVPSAWDSRLVFVRTSDHGEGGTDRIEGGADDDLLIGGSAGDSIDGDAGSDLIFGDQVSLERRVGDTTSLRFQTLDGTLLYGVGADGILIPLTDGAARPYRDSDLDAPTWAAFRILDLFHSQALFEAVVAPGKAPAFGADAITGGAGDDMIFGQLGDDVLLGDGALEDGPAVARRLPGAGDPLGALILHGSVDRATDGDDYIEGGGGDDVVFGGLGQDDLIGGSSSLFGLTTDAQRPDGHDYLFGGSGTRIGIDATTDDLADRHSRDADVIVGDNGDIVRVVGRSGNDGAPTAPYVTWAHDDSAGRKIVVRAVTLLGAAGGDDEIHGESGDDAIYAGGGADRVFGDAEDDDLIGGAGHDWISGGTGSDGILGDEGRIRTHRSGSAEPLAGIPAMPGNGALVKLGALEGAAGGGDVLFGGLGDDVIAGGAGDDAISGAEALPEGYAADVRDSGAPFAIVRSDFTRPYNPGGLLHFGIHGGAVLPDFALFDEAHPYTKILVDGREFFLNFSPVAGPKPGAVHTDGDDQLAGGDGNDWIVGGTGRDALAGGNGDDVLQADDDLSTGGGTNLFPDEDPTYADTLTGGSGRDVFLTNQAGDQVLDGDDDPNTGPTDQPGVPLPVTPGQDLGSAPAPGSPSIGLNPSLDPGAEVIKPLPKKKKKKCNAKCKRKKKAAAKKKAAKKKAALKKRRAAAKKRAAKKRQQAAATVRASTSTHQKRAGARVVKGATSP